MQLKTDEWSHAVLGKEELITAHSPGFIVAAPERY